MMQSPYTVSDEDLKKVIADFLDMGHVENIVAMFHHEPLYYQWTGDILRDERFNVRLGVAILFEELKSTEPEKLSLAVPSVAELLLAPQPLLRGEAISLLGIIGGPAALALIKGLASDPDPQVREMVTLVLEDLP
jgi:HEAT repeat protein